MADSCAKCGTKLGLIRYNDKTVQGQLCKTCWKSERPKDTTDYTKHPTVIKIRTISWIVILVSAAVLILTLLPR